ncbi:hypothetical protein [Streptosporangium sp. NPDC087985]|uniref:hypothetical protein n=1 Tax=Streptosporangium sp. NPDC087985 TaxID=3366196 RepID=UPI00380DF50A
MTLTRELLAYYEQDREHDRLREGRGRLEFWRTPQPTSRARWAPSGIARRMRGW